MVLFRKYVFFIVVITVFPFLGFGQQVASDSSAILMTRAELETFLSNIAVRKKKKNEEKKRAEQIELSLYGNASRVLPPSNQGVDLNREIVKLNNRIDLLTQSENEEKILSNPFQISNIQTEPLTAEKQIQDLRKDLEFRNLQNTQQQGLITELQDKIRQLNNLSSSDQVSELRARSTNNVTPYQSQLMYRSNDVFAVEGNQSSQIVPIGTSLSTGNTFSNDPENAELRSRVETLNNEVASLSRSLNARTSRTSSQDRQIADLQSRINSFNANLSRRNNQGMSSSDRQRLLSEIQALSTGVIAAKTLTTKQQPIVVYQHDPNNRDTVFKADSIVLNKFAETQNQTKRLQEQIDSLQKVINGQSTQLSDSTAEKSNQLQEKNDVLNNQLHEKKNDDAILRYARSLYFENNSIELTRIDMGVLQELSNVVKQNKDIQIVLKGYASTVGNASYNRQISVRRAQAVKNKLLQFGVKKERVFTEGYGSDESKDEQFARRVEITLKFDE